MAFVSQLCDLLEQISILYEVFIHFPRPVHPFAHTFSYICICNPLYCNHLFDVSGHLDSEVSQESFVSGSVLEKLNS